MIVIIFWCLKTLWQSLMFCLVYKHVMSNPAIISDSMFFLFLLTIIPIDKHVNIFQGSIPSFQFVYSMTSSEKREPLFEWVSICVSWNRCPCIELFRFSPLKRHVFQKRQSCLNCFVSSSLPPLSLIWTPVCHFGWALHIPLRPQKETSISNLVICLHSHAAQQTAFHISCFRSL